jgi:HEAT repeat protein
VVALEQIGPASIPALREALGEPSVSVRLGALRAVEMFGPAAKDLVPALREALKDQDFQVRAHAAAALGTMGEDAKEATPELLNALQDKHMPVQVQAANTLVGLAALGVPGLFEKIKEADRKGRWSLPFILEKFGPRGQDAVASLLKDLRDKDPKVRAQAATGLAALGAQAKAAIAALNKALEDEDADVRTAAALALTQIDAQWMQQKNNRERLDRLLGKELPLPHAPGLSWRELPPEVVHKIMDDPKAQARFLRLFKGYVGVVIATDHQIREDFKAWRAQADLQLDSVGPEAVLALIAAINEVVRWRLGFY